MKKQLLSMILVITICFALFPVTAHADSDHIFRATLEANVDTAVRNVPYRDGSIVVRVAEGDVLKVTNAITNEYGNVWYKVMTPAGEGYVYSEKTREHCCTYHQVAGNDAILFCECGNVVASNKQVLQNISLGDAATLPAPVDVLSPESLEALHLALGAAMAVAAPYAAVVVVGGVVIFIAVQAKANKVTLERAEVEWKALNDYRPSDGLYYDGVLCNGVMFVNIANPMDEYDAIRSVDHNINSYLNLLKENEKAKAPLWFVYTPLDLSAMCLADDYCAVHPGFRVENYWGDAHDRENCMSQFKHYHIVSDYTVPNPHLGGHIIYGAPCLDTFHEGAWA